MKKLFHMAVATAAVAFVSLPDVVLAQTPNSGATATTPPAATTAPEATTPPAATTAPAATTTPAATATPAATTTAPDTTPATTTTDKAAPKKKKPAKMTRQQEIDKSVDSGTVPARYRSSIPKEYHQYIPFAK